MGGVGGRNKPGDWVCPSCNDLVFSKRDKCNKCGTDKTADVQIVGKKQGDWMCPTCGALCFASRSECKMCGTPKSESAVEIAGKGIKGGPGETGGKGFKGGKFGKFGKGHYSPY